MLMEVRCCCVPTKLLGWMQVPAGELFPRFPLTVERPTRWPPPRPTAQFEQLMLPIAPFTESFAGGWKRWLCVKAEETPIETLRRVPGFRENDGSVLLFFRRSTLQVDSPHWLMR